MEKYCTKCAKTKKIKEFNNKSSTKDGKQKHCRKCSNTYSKEHYISNTSYYVDKASNRRKSTKEFINSLKSVPCVDCKISYPYYVMEFDHQYDKKFTIATEFGNVSKEALLAEIDKCDVVCANCHRERTHKRLLEVGVTGNTSDFESEDFGVRIPAFQPNI